MGKISISESIDMIIPSTTCNFEWSERKRMKALWVVTFIGRTFQNPLEPAYTYFPKGCSAWMLAAWPKSHRNSALIDAAGEGRRTNYNK